MLLRCLLRTLCAGFKASLGLYSPRHNIEWRRGGWPWGSASRVTVPVWVLHHGAVGRLTHIPRVADRLGLTMLKYPGKKEERMQVSIVSGIGFLPGVHASAYRPCVVALSSRLLQQAWMILQLHFKARPPTHHHRHCIQLNTTRVACLKPSKLLRLKIQHQTPRPDINKWSAQDPWTTRLCTNAGLSLTSSPMASLSDHFLYHARHRSATPSTPATQQRLPHHPLRIISSCVLLLIKQFTYY